MISTLLLAGFQPAYAEAETVLYSFGSYSGDGQNPSTPLIIDKEGNLYSTTVNSGANGYGTVFKLTPKGKESLLYSFCSQSNCADGESPSSGVIMDKEGNLYGTTRQGGANNWGAVFKLTRNGEESVLYSFGTNSGDGEWPGGGLILDKEGNLYGTTSIGGANGGGTVFKVTPSGEETVLYSFGSHSGDGTGPSANLIIDTKNNFYSTTSGGGANGNGTVFKVTLTGEETVLYSFGNYDSGDGANPFTGLVMDKEGNLYGTTSTGGAYNDGIAFKLTRGGEEKVLHSFGAGTEDGIGPNQLILDEAGTLYGTTALGSGSCYGTVFKMTFAGKETILHHFIVNTGDGVDPAAALVESKGNLYGTTVGGGHNAYGYGTVFKVTR